MSASISSSLSGGSAMRSPPPSSASARGSGRLSSRTRIGDSADQSSIWAMKSSSPRSAHCTSSKTITTGHGSRDVRTAVARPRTARPGRSSALPSSSPSRRSEPASTWARQSRRRGEDVVEHPASLPRCSERLRPARSARACAPCRRWPRSRCPRRIRAIARDAQDRRGEAVGVLLELPGQPRLADPGLAPSTAEPQPGVGLEHPREEVAQRAAVAVRARRAAARRRSCGGHRRRGPRRASGATRAPARACP